MKKTITIAIAALTSSLAYGSINTDTESLNAIENYYHEVSLTLQKQKMESIREMNQINFTILLADIEPVYARVSTTTNSETLIAQSEIEIKTTENSETPS